MNWSAGKIGTTFKEPAHANGLSTPPISCVLHLIGLPGGGSKIYDRSPYGNIGTITGAVWKRLPSGLWYLDFDGTDDTVDCGNGASLQISNRITLEVWALLSEVNATENMNMITKTGTKIGFNLSVQKNTQIVEGGFHNGSDWTSKVTTSSSIDLDAWYHLAYTYDKVTHRIYINGVKDNTNPDTNGGVPDTTHDLYLGSAAPVDGRYYPGNITLARIYNRALSALEIQNHYQQEKHLFGVW